MKILSITAMVLFSSAALGAEGGFQVNVFRAKPGYLLQETKHQPALDLIQQVPWLNPGSGQLESPVAEQVTANFPVLDFSDPDVPGGDGNFDPTDRFPGDQAGADDDHFALLAEGMVRIPKAGYWSFIVGRSGTFAFTLNGRLLDEDGRALSGVCCHGAAPVFTFFLPEGDVPLVLTYGESTGPAFLELFAAEGAGVPFEPFGPYHLVGDVAGGGLEVFPLTPCDDPPEVAVIDGIPAGPLATRDSVTLDAGGSQSGGPGSLSFKWSIVSGRGVIEGPDDGPTAVIASPLEGLTTVKLVVDDGICSNPASKEVVLDFRVVNPANWTITYFKPVPGYLLDRLDHQPVRNLIAGVPWPDPVSGDLVNPTAYTVTVKSAVIDFVDPDAPGQGGIFPASAPFPEGTGEENEDQFAVLATGIVRIPVDGFYSFIVGHDDTFELSVNGETVDQNGVPTTSGCCDTTNPVFTFQLPAGDLPFTLSYGESDGGAFLELLASPGMDTPYHDDGFYRLVGDAGHGGFAVIADCNDDPEVALVTGLPAGPIHPGVPFTLDGSGSSAGGGAVRPLIFRWTVLSGPAAIVGPDDEPTVQIMAQSEGRVLVKLTVDDGVCADPTSTQVSVVIDPAPGATWIRGDSNGDRTVDISDAVFTLQFLFGGGDPAACEPALDSNLDHQTDISDPVTDLGSLFLGTPLPEQWQQCENFAGCAVNCPRGN